MSKIEKKPLCSIPLISEFNSAQPTLLGNENGVLGTAYLKQFENVISTDDIDCY